jgi:hypothetical protein
LFIREEFEIYRSANSCIRIKSERFIFISVGLISLKNYTALLNIASSFVFDEEAKFGLVSSENCNVTKFGFGEKAET